MAEFRAGSSRQWPFRALLPWAESLDDWHAWGSEMAQGLAAASRGLREPALLGPAIGDTAGFTAQLLTATGPDNGWLPVPLEKVQIAYGADARVRACYEVGRASGRDGIRRLAGIAAGWFFGANRAGAATYDPATGVTFDGVEADGRLNRNSGAESTIHGLLTMQVLDAAPELAGLARASARIETRDGLTVIEAEEADMTGATVATPDPAWTGESLWSGKQVVARDGATLSWELPASDQARLVQPVLALRHGSGAVVGFHAGSRSLGEVRIGAVGRPGDAASEYRLTPVALPRTAAADARRLTATLRGGTATLDALLVMPEVARYAASGTTGSVVLLTSRSERRQTRRVSLGGGGRAQAVSYDRNGARTRSATVGDAVVVEPGGFTLVFRAR